MKTKIRHDLVYYPDPTDPDRRLVKDPIRNVFFRYNELQIAMMEALDGKRSLEEVRDLLEAKYDTELPVSAISRFITRLEQNLLLDLSSYSVNDKKSRAAILKGLKRRTIVLRVKARDGSTEEGRLFEAATRELMEGDPCKAAIHLHAVLDINPKNERARQILLATHQAFFKFRDRGSQLYHLVNPDRFLGAVDRAVGRLIFSPIGVAAITLFVVTGLFELGGVVSVLADRSFTFWDFVVVFTLGNLSAMFHEMSHGLACKHAGGRVTDIGFQMILGISPSAYCDTSDTYTFARRRDKIIVQLAGVIGSLIWLAFLLHLLALTDVTFPLWVGLAWSAMQTLITLPKNAIPFVPYDAYYALVDWLQIPNLRPRALGYFMGRVKLFVLGLPPTDPAPTPRERRVFRLFGLLTFVYSAVFMYTMYVTILLPLAVKHLGMIGLLIVVWFLVWKVGMPLTRIVWEIVALVWKERSRIFTLRRSLALAAVSAGVVFALSADWPLHVHASMKVEPHARADVRVSETGLLVALHVRSGDRVKAGQLVATLRSDEISRDRLVATQELKIAQVLTAQARTGARPEELALVDVTRRRAEVGSAVAARRLTDTQRMLALGVDSGQSLMRAQSNASRAGGEARVKAAQQDIVTAGARVEQIAELEANERRLMSQIENLDNRLAQLEIRSPIDGTVVSPQVDTLIGKSFEPGAVLFEIHDTSRWRVRITPDEGQPLDGLATGQRIRAAAFAAPDAPAELRVDEIMPPADDHSAMVIYATPAENLEWRSGMSGQARIYTPPRSIAYRVFVLPITRLIDFDLQSI